MSKTIAITYLTGEDGSYDFNIPSIPVDVLAPLLNLLKWQMQKQIAIDTAPSFKEERLNQHRRHLDHCIKTGSIPKQQFIDFPLY